MIPIIDADRLPHTALRSAELYLKRRTLAVEHTAVQRLAALYTEAYRDLRAVLDEYPRLTRAQLLYAADQRLARLKTAALLSIEQSVRTAFVGAYFGRLWLLDVATGEQVRIRVVPPTADALQEDQYDTLITQLFGKGWRDQFGNELDDLIVAVRRAIGAGLIEGDDMDDIARRVKNAMGVQTDRRRGKQGSDERRGYRANFNRVQTMTRTVVQTVANKGAVAAYRANKDVLSGYEWLTAHDERVCPDCRGMDGKVFTWKQRKLPPLHPQCRCTVIPVIKPDALEDSAKAPRKTLKAWAQGFGMEATLADFLVGK